MRIWMIILIAFIAATCFTPTKGDEYELKNVQVIDIKKVELGFDIYFRDGFDNFKSFVKDTSGYQIGSCYLILVKS